MEHHLSSHPYRIIHPPPSASAYAANGSDPPPTYAPMGLSRKPKSIVHLMYDRQRGGGSRGQSCHVPASSSSVFLPRTYCTVPSNTNNANISRRKFTSYSRQIYPCTSLDQRIAQFAEYASVTRFHSSYLPLQPNAVSTISIAFSTDGQLLASTHGDHTVKISCCYSGRLVSVCSGHPRTPWTVKFHPTKTELLASGCLGYQVRIWNIGSISSSLLKQQPQQATCINFIRLHYAIISLSFHPSVEFLVIASGDSVHLWDYTQIGASSSDRTNNNNNNNRSNSNNYQSAVEWKHPEALRCVTFTPDGTSIIIGGVNKVLTGEEPQQGMTFALKLWDFSVSQALPSPTNSGLLDMQRATTNPRMFVSRALLYNDGGFDISPCGQFLVCCADIWLPVRMNTAMELYSIDEALKQQAGNYDDNDEVDCFFEEIMVAGRCHYTDTNTDSPPRRTDPQTTTSTSTLSETISGNDRDSFMSISPQPQLRTTSSAALVAATPHTPPSLQQRIALSPPSPPGRRFGRYTGDPTFLTLNSHTSTNNNNSLAANRHLPRRDGAPSAGLPTMFERNGTWARRESTPTPNEQNPNNQQEDSIPIGGRYVPHVVLVKIPSSTPDNHSNSNNNRLQQQQSDMVLHAAPLERSTASGVTCVKFSPTASYCLLGYGVRETHAREGEPHRVTALYQVDGMHNIATLTSTRDDVNIARFHPISGHGFVYGTKQGRVRVLSCKPWC
mmetsp:Transcript_12466/g.17938  ORF Transcript_12466/g.17938 Transcript_12466/m.17938 type:complete len:726 (+) Transcript_12466:168-2345(+)